MASLRDLIGDDPILGHVGSLDVPIRAIKTDSREVEAGDLFVCLPGYRTEGGETRADRHEFVPVAVERGARALVVDRPVAPPQGVTVVQVRDCWGAVASMSCRQHGHPSREMVLVGVTGTSGKTSTTYFLESILRAADHRVARIGTIEYLLGDRVVPAGQTTPEAPVVQALLREAVARGCTAGVMEVSSHALALRRVDGVDFDAAAFTNVSRDHLNFHPDMEHYVWSKSRLFDALGRGVKQGAAVVNVDDPASEVMIRANRGALLTYGLRDDAQICARDVAMTMQGVTFEVRTPAGRSPVRLRHLGEYSVYNALAAIAVGHGLGLDLRTVVAGIEAAPTVPGRFELVDEGQDFVVVVDYAHKPDALARLLDSARNLRPRRLVTVFGCGGDRDRGKRPVMGRIAAQKSDYVVVTSDNPRSEDPGAIIDDILGGVREVDAAASKHVAEPDRAAAIRLAISTAGPDDLVVVAGKGHETYQLVRGRRFDFDDREHARRAVRERFGRR